jgi:hypothetical protein
VRRLFTMLVIFVAVTCSAADGLKSILGPVGSEDLVRVPGTPWLIASGLNLGAPAHFYVVDTRKNEAAVLFPVASSRLELDRKQTPGCGGPPDLSRLSTDGLALRPGANGKHLLYAANHGDRMAIEMFEVDAHAGAQPKLRWVGCIPLPDRTLPNGVAALPDGGLLVTSFYDPTEGKKAWDRMVRGEISGRLLEWHAASGFKDVPDAAFSGANGVELSADASEVYVSAWSSRKIVILSRKNAPRREIPLDFLPDNIHRLADGSLLVAGQRTDVAKIAACTVQCPQPWVVVRIDPKRGSVQTLLSEPGTELVNYASGALRVGNTLYITVRGDRRILYRP